jgi:hypothetical protein
VLGLRSTEATPPSSPSAQRAPVRLDSGSNHKEIPLPLFGQLLVGFACQNAQAIRLLVEHLKNKETRRVQRLGGFVWRGTV